MFFPSSSLPLRLAACGLLGALVPVGRACGPDFPNAYLATSPEGLAELPTLSFPAELTRLLPAGATASQPTVSPSTRDTADRGERDEILEVLIERGVPRRRLESLLARYQRTEPPAELPREFQLYAAGARAWHRDDLSGALAAWREVLALPAEQRHHRTVWAAYMIGRALWETDEETARAAFQQARDAAAKGMADSEGLATASLGWEARSHYQGNAFAPALRLYFQQFTAGDAGAVPSLQLVLQKLLADETEDAALRPVAADAPLRGVVTAWFTSRGGPHAPWSLRATKQFRRWLAALPQDQTLPPAEADRWAWAAYQNGMWREAEAFAQVAASDAPASEWVRAMLRLREGDVAAAAGHLAGAARAFPNDGAMQSPYFAEDDSRFAATHEDLPRQQLDGVQGVLALQREQYQEALRLFLTAGHWSDAAYVAERVLSLGELMTFVQHEVPAPKPSAPGEVTPSHEASLARALRHLLARRLVRAGRFDDAREFFPAELAPTLDRYVGLVRDGYREENPRQLRALALWQAAQLARESGMELQGTELDPDFSIWGGGHPWPDIATVRLTDGSRESQWRSYDRQNVTGVARAIVASDDELTRTARGVMPTRRYHYRQRAAELAFLAASLLPDNDDLTATVLNTSGRWIAPQYPEDAQLFYKTLVFRCGHTRLGQRAAERRWFVPPEEADNKP